MHDARFQFTERSTVLNPTDSAVEGQCEYSLFLYASDDFEPQLDCSSSGAIVLGVALFFAGIVLTFFLYDIYVSRRHDRLLDDATRSNALLSTLFPKSVQDRLLASFP